MPGPRINADVVRALQPSGVIGALEQMPLTEILQNLDFAKKSARVDAWPERAEGVVHVHDGQIVRAMTTTSAGVTEGEDAIRELCCAPRGYFQIEYVREAVERNVHRPTTFVLLEVLRVIDEQNANPADRADPTDHGALGAHADRGAVPAPIDLDAPLLSTTPNASLASSKTAPRDDAETPAYALDDELDESAWEDASATLDIDEIDAAAEQDLAGLIAEGEFLVAAGDLESARRVLARAQGMAPENDDVRVKLLNVNESIDAAQAKAYLESAMRGGPHAVELARRAVQLRPVREVLLRSLAVFARGGAHDEVADVAEQLLELDPNDEGALRTLVDANSAMKRYAVALRAAKQLVRLHPDDEQLRATLQRVQAQAAKDGA